MRFPAIGDGSVSSMRGGHARSAQGSGAPDAPKIGSEEPRASATPTPSERTSIQQGVQRLAGRRAPPKRKSTSSLLSAKVGLELVRSCSADSIGKTKTTHRWNGVSGELRMDSKDAYAAVINASAKDSGGWDVLQMIVRESAPAHKAQPSLRDAKLRWNPAESPARVVSDTAAVVQFEASEKRTRPNDAIAVVFFDRDGHETKRVGTTSPDAWVLLMDQVGDAPSERMQTRVYEGEVDRMVSRLASSNTKFDAPDQAFRSALWDQRRKEPVEFERVRVTARIDRRAPGAWLDRSPQDAGMALEFAVGRGLHVLPNTRVVAGYDGFSESEPTLSDLRSNDPDWQLTNEPRTSRFPVESYRNIGRALESELTLYYVDSQGGSDQYRSMSLAEFVFAEASQHLKVGGAPFQILGEAWVDPANAEARKLSAALWESPKGELVPLVSLEKGFLESSDPKCSLKGWRVEVGYRDSTGDWQGAGPIELKHEPSSPAKLLKLPQIRDPKLLSREGGKPLEVLVYNADGVPAQRLLIPLHQLEYKTSVPASRPRPSPQGGPATPSH